MKNLPDEGCRQIVYTLKEAGYETYLVGGALRNHLLGQTVDDYDLTTSAPPQEVMALFPDSLPTGIKHGTVSVRQGQRFYELTTFRSESGYSDSRHPDAVTFVSDLSEDLKRRDFTINAMAYDLINDRLIDLFQGQDDLKSRLIRTVGDPEDRFQEDALRILRAIRFASRLNFNIHPDTLKAMAEKAPGLAKVSAERIFQELQKILLCDYPDLGLELMLYSGVLKVILPELLPMAGFRQFTSYHDKDVFFHTLEVVKNTRAELCLRLAALFHDSGKPAAYSMDEEGRGHFYGHEDLSRDIAEKVLKRLKVDQETSRKTLKLVAKHMVSPHMKKPVKLKQLINEFGPEEIGLLFELKAADQSAKPVQKEADTDLAGRVQEILDRRDPLTLKDLAVTGQDLINLGIPPGPGLGSLLQDLLDEVLANPDLNDKDTLLRRALHLKGRNHESSSH